MVISHILAPIHSLGPGERIGIWTQGCTKSCAACMSPNLQSFEGTIIDDATFSKVIRQLADMNGCRALTISGGDPFEQADSLIAFLRNVRADFEDILVYTGFELKELLDGRAGESGRQCLEFIDVLIDGRYEIDKNIPDCILRGSSNQKIYFFKDALREKYNAYMKKGRIVETFVHGTDTIITGILNREEYE